MISAGLAGEDAEEGFDVLVGAGVAVAVEVGAVGIARGAAGPSEAREERGYTTRGGGGVAPKGRALEWVL